MKRILVFTSIERAFYSSVIEYQLLEPIVEVSKRSKNKFMYLGFIPISFWFSPHYFRGKSFRLYRANRRRIKQFLVTHNIRCSFIPIVFPIRHKDFYLRIPWLILYLLNTIPLLLYFVLRYRISLIHARNYPAGLLCFFTRSLLGVPYNFDMRDLYPEKGIEAGMFGNLGKKNSWSYKLWKFIELNLLQAANSIIVTSTPFYEYVRCKMESAGWTRHNARDTSPSAKQDAQLKIIPNSVNPSRFKPDDTKRARLRAFYGVGDKFVLIHSGAFGTAQDIPIVGKYFLKWKSLIRNDVHLIILYGTKKYLPYIREVLEGVGVHKEDYTLISPNPDEVPSLLLLGDVGLHLESMAIATPYCIAVKDGEYLASGLPVIVTPWLKGIAPLIEKYSAGIVVNLFDKECAKEHKLIEAYEDMRANGFSLVKEELSSAICVNRLLELYQ